MVIMDVAFGAAMGTREHMDARGSAGENPLTRAGIEAGKKFVKK